MTEELELKGRFENLLHHSKWWVKWHTSAIYWSDSKELEAFFIEMEIWSDGKLLKIIKYGGSDSDIITCSIAQAVKNESVKELKEATKEAVRILVDGIEWERSC